MAKKKYKFERGLQAAAAAVEARVNESGREFFDCIEEAQRRNVEVEVVLAERARAKAAQLYKEIEENMNPQRWA